MRSNRAREGSLWISASRAPFKSKSIVPGRKIDFPGAPGRVFDLKGRSCGSVRRCVPAIRDENTNKYCRLLNSDSGPEIVDLRGRSGPLLPQSPPEKVGGEAPHLFQWVLQ